MKVRVTHPYYDTQLHRVGDVIDVDAPDKARHELIDEPIEAKAEELPPAEEKPAKEAKDAPKKEPAKRTRKK